MKRPPLLVLLLVLSSAGCGGLVEEQSVTPPQQQIVIHGQLAGRTVDCGIAGPSSCYQGSLALGVWLLPRSDAWYCRVRAPRWCSLGERRPLAQATASADGRFMLTTNEGDYRLVVIYRNTLRPLTEQSASEGDGGFHLTAERFKADQVFEFPAVGD